MPAINTALLKFSPEEVTKILTYGRANTPMPAWGVAGGGPMNDQQISDLVAYLDSIKLTPDQARKQVLENDIEPQAKADGTSPSDGATLFKANCARCHTQGWSIGDPLVMGGGAFGPNITGGSEVRQFPDDKAMIEFVTAGSEFGKPYGARGQGGDEGGGMPGFGLVLTQDQIKAIVEYERGL